MHINICLVKRFLLFTSTQKYYSKENNKQSLTLYFYINRRVGYLIKPENQLCIMYTK